MTVSSDKSKITYISMAEQTINFESCVCLMFSKHIIVLINVE